MKKCERQVLFVTNLEIQAVRDWIRAALHVIPDDGSRDQLQGFMMRALHEGKPQEIAIGIASGKQLLIDNGKTPVMSEPPIKIEINPTHVGETQ